MRSAASSTTSPIAAQLGGVGVRVGERDLDLGADDRQRRAQLVARVGHEAALAVEGGGQAVEHPVDGVREVAQLVLGAAHLDPLVHPLLRDAPGEPGHPPQRRQRAARDEVAERGREDQRAAKGEQELGVQLGECRVGERWAGSVRSTWRCTSQELTPSSSAPQPPKRQRVEEREAQPEGHTR